MKRILAVAGLMLALNGYTQSYMVMNNGVTLTTDKNGFVYDFGHFVFAYKMTVTGGQFLVEDGKLITIDEKGFLYRKDEKVPSKLKGKGNNYFIHENGTLYTIDAQGFFYKYDKESATKKAVGFGGNFFTVKPNDKKPEMELFTMNSLGNYFKMNVSGLDVASIAKFGGSYFQTNKGVVYTINKDGLVFEKSEIKVGPIKKMGGNFFIDSNNKIFTVSEEGYLYLPVIPASLNVETVTKLGQNYFLDQEGKLFVVDALGVVFQREVTSHDLRNVKILSI